MAWAIFPQPNQIDIALLLGGGVAFKGGLLVEDEAAKHFLLTLMEELEPALLKQFEVVNARSESGISAALKAMPRTKEWLSLIGVFDGDMHTTVNATQFQWDHVFLPGDSAPDHLMTGLRSAPDFVGLVSAELRKTEDQVRIAMQAAAGLDFHDYVRVLASAIGLDALTVRRGLTRLWLRDAQNSEHSREFIRQLLSTE